MVSVREKLPLFLLTMLCFQSKKRNITSTESWTIGQMLCNFLCSLCTVTSFHSKLKHLHNRRLDEIEKV